MESLKIALWLLILTMCFNGACQHKESSDKQTEEIFKSLKENQARILIKINGKEFYPTESVFTGQVLMSDQVLSVTLTDQFEGKTILNLGKAKWYASDPVKGHIDANNQVGTNLKIGKLIDRGKLIGEGYMMAEGEIEAVQFLKDKMVFRLSGKVGKYSDFQQPDKFLPLEGMIVYKKPAFSLANITEKEAFSSSTTK